MNITIPEKHREQFDLAANFAIEKETFTPDELAAHMNTSVLVASIMVGYMEKAGLITKGKGNDVRRAKITLDEWQAIDCSIDLFEPAPEPIQSVFVANAEAVKTIDIASLIPSERLFIKKTLSAEGESIIIDDGVPFAIPIDEITEIYLRRGGLFSKGYITFTADGSKISTLTFKNRYYKKIKAFAEAFAEAIGSKITVKE